jgi:hypothetical protein
MDRFSNQIDSVYSSAYSFINWSGIFGRVNKKSYESIYLPLIHIDSMARGVNGQVRKIKRRNKNG